jgi:uncharacterized protein (DUF169 family)
VLSANSRRKIMVNWEELVSDFQALLRPRTHLLGWRILETKEELDKIPEVRRVGHRFFYCQALTLARTMGWTIGASPAKNDFWCPLTTYGGFMPEPDWSAISDEDYSRCPTVDNYWVSSKEDAKKRLDAMPKLPAGKYEAMVVGPLYRHNFEPQVVLFYGTPAQMSLLINGLQWTGYEPLQFYSVGEGACTDSILRCFLTQKPSLTIPCFGERALGGVAEDELDIAMTPESFVKAIEGLKALFARGLRYPIRAGDPIVSPGPAFFELAYRQKPEGYPLTLADITE